MSLRVFKYSLSLIIYVGAFWSFTTTGWQVWLPLFYAWILTPVLELFLPANTGNLDPAAEEAALADRRYDFVLYLIVLLQYIVLVKFLFAMSDGGMSTWDLIGRIWVMGLVCGVFGINGGHELGHRSKKWEQFLAKLLLLSSQYTHFFIEHNKGHHKRVATPEDPSSAHYGEWVYHFYYRSIIFSYLSAWQIARKELRKKGRPFLSIHNEMIQYSLLQLLFLVAMLIIFGWFSLLCYIIAAGIGILLLETVNYIEHYGLNRQSLGDGKYERAMPAHSWNSDHIIGRLMLFELSRHSDHHYLASRKYQALRHHDDSPQMPTGYPGMMLLALVPPLWFMVMNKRVKEWPQKKESGERER